MAKYVTRPALIKGPWSWLTTSYGIDKDLIYSRKSFLGMLYGERHELPIDQVTRTHAKGTVFGDVVFGEGPHDPVVWKSVFRPERKLRRARAVLAAIKTSMQPPAPPWHQDVELTDYAILIPVIPEMLLSGLRHYFDTPYDTRVAAKKTWLRQGEPIVGAVGPNLLAPVDGQIVAVGYAESGYFEKYLSSGGEDLFGLIYAAVQPVRSSLVNREVLFSEVRSWLESIFHKRPKHQHDTESFRKAVVKETGEWMEMPLKIVPMESLGRYPDGVGFEVVWQELEDL